MRSWRPWLGLALAVSSIGLGCSKSSTAIGITIAPTTATVLINQNASFVPAVTGTTNGVIWQVNKVTGGNSTVGTISTNGLYTAPGVVPNPATVTITATISGTSTSTTATVTISSGIQVTINPASFTVGTGESFPFTATVIGVPVNAVTATCDSTGATASLPSCNAVTWSVSGGGNVGATTGIYTAPNTVTASIVTVTATSVFDTSQTATAVVTLVAATDPTLVSIGPNTGARGAVFQDVYLSGTNFISTTNVFINGKQVPTADVEVSTITCATLTTTNSSGTSVPIPPCTSASLTAGATVLRVRVPDIFLATQLPFPSTNSVFLNFTAARQKGTQQGCTPDPSQCQLVLSPQRPVIVGTTPDSIQPSAGTAFSFNVDGGFYGTALNPVVTAQFNGAQLFPSINAQNPDRQLTVTASTSAASQPGLYQLGVTSDTSGIAPATSNIAVPPRFPFSPTALATLPVGTKPYAVAINSATGQAVVANETSNDVYVIDLTQPAPVVIAKICTGVLNAASVENTAGTCTTPTGPTSVAIDNVQNIALVTNSAANSIAVINLNSMQTTQILTPGPVINDTTIPQVPISVGINAVTSRAVVAYQGTFFALLVDTSNLGSGQACPAATAAVEPQCIVGIVNISTGANPRVAVSPKLNWALVTPGGLGSLAIVNLSQVSTNTIALGSSNGVSRSGGTVTVTTTSTHSLQVGQPVLITGVQDASFNGLYSVVSVPSSTTFTYTQSSTLPNTTSGSAANNNPPPACSEPNPPTSCGATIIYGQAVATVATSLTTSGVAINDQTFKAVLTDPTQSIAPATIFSVLDQTSVGVSSNGIAALPANGTIAAAFNPLTNIAVLVNQFSRLGYVVDASVPTILASFPVGANPWDVAIDPGTDYAVVLNQTDNTASIIPLGTIRAPQILQVSPAQLYLNSTLTSSLVPQSQVLTLVGEGFTGSSTVRLDGVAVPTTSVSNRVIQANIPANMLTGAHEYSVDVSNSGALSNVASLKVIQAISVSGFSCTTPAPAGVAIDAPNNIALVSDAACNEVYLINLATGLGQIVSVGNNPLGIAVSPKGDGFAAVANAGSSSVSFINDLSADVTATIGTDAGPSGVAIDPVLNQVAITAAGAASLDIVSATSTNGASATPTAVGQGPVAIAIDPIRHLAAVGNETSNSISLVPLSASSAAASSPGVQLPTGIAYEPITGDFIISSSVNNQIEVLNPDTQEASPVRVGINPTSLAYNYATSTLVTTNTAGGNMTVMDFVTGTVRQVFPLSSSGQFAVAIHPLTNVAVVADAANSRVLFVPLP